MAREASNQKVFLRVLSKLGDECLWRQTPPRRLLPLLLLLLPLLPPHLLSHSDRSPARPSKKGLPYRAKMVSAAVNLRWPRRRPRRLQCTGPWAAMPAEFDDIAKRYLSTPDARRHPAAAALWPANRRSSRTCDDSREIRASNLLIWSQTRHRCAMPPVFDEFYKTV